MNKVIEDETWTDSAGTFDPVKSGAALSALEHPAVEEPDPASEPDSLSEYMSRETAYLEAVPERD